MRTPSAILFAAILTITSTAYSFAEEITKQQMVFFETEVRPLLVKHCYECHAGEENKGDLQVNSRAALLLGGESGPCIEPGKPEESLLIEAINYESYEMPPSGQLKPAQIEVLTKWIKMGAPWPNDGKNVPSVIKKKEKITDEDRSYWAFQPLKEHQAPKVNNTLWNQSIIDRFIYARLQKEGIQPAQPANKQTLLRRLSFDLTGLPPSQTLMNQFLQDDSSTAYEKVVDQLLSSPRYGEKMATHWLDLVRYAESDGYRADYYRPHAWRYRDYVIDSFNQDKPYDQFVIEQLAGDEYAPTDPNAIVATGYLRHWIYEWNQRDVETQWKIILEDITDTTGDVFLGMGMGCAKCHDHKFDPILQNDYYRLQAFFAPLLPRDDVPIATQAEIAEYEQDLNEWEEKTEVIRTRIAELEEKAVSKGAKSALIKFPPEIQEMMNKAPEDREPYEHQLAEMANLQVLIEIKKARGKVDKEHQEEFDKLTEELKKHPKPKDLPRGYSVTDTGKTAPTVFIPDKHRLGEIQPGFLTVIDPSNIEVDPLRSSTGRRSELARWITSEDNQLANRVIANRVWQWVFGRGLVPTANDFGHLGEEPSHPELLDYLTLQFIKNGRSIKKLQKEILLSQAYQQSSFNHDAKASQLDPTNKLIWKANIRRLSAEQVRDAILAVSGDLDLKVGGSSVTGSSPRRSVYLKVHRNSRDPILNSFDFPLRFNSDSTRNTTTTANQALLMINGQFPISRAKNLAKRSRTNGGNELEQFVKNAFEFSYSRPALPEEVAASVDFIRSQADRITESKKPDNTKKLSLKTLKNTKHQGIMFGTKDTIQKLAATSSLKFPTKQFTIDTIVQLDSMYEDASVRTIASQWNGNTSTPGWNLGVTSKKSRYTPRNLIMQLVGKNSEGKTQYEVIPSGLHLEIGKAYHVQVAVNLEDTTEAGIHFTLQELGTKDAKIETAQVSHSVISGINNSFPLLIGGRSTSTRSSWHGLIHTFSVFDKSDALSDKAIAPMYQWKFDNTDTALIEKLNGKLVLEIDKSGSSSSSTPLAEAQTDFCHLLLNSNEFIYLD